MTSLVSTCFILMAVQLAVTASARLKKLRFNIDTVNDTWIAVGKFKR